MAIRRGRYAVYRGREYRAVVEDDGSVSLLSSDESDQQNGFVLLEPGRYVRRVQRDDLSEVYSVKTYAEYRGHSFAISQEEGGRLLLVEGLRTQLAKELGFSEVEWGVWERWVDRSDLVRIWEERTPL